jgi:hypothetical protein
LHSLFFAAHFPGQKTSPLPLLQEAFVMTSPFNFQNYRFPTSFHSSASRDFQQPCGGFTYSGTPLAFVINEAYFTKSPAGFWCMDWVKRREKIHYFLY